MEEAPRKAATGASKKSPTASFYRVIRALTPIPYLAKARDFYIRSMSHCAGRASYSGVASGGLEISAITLPKSFSTSSIRNDDEFAELVRNASQSNKSSHPPQKKEKKEIRRSFSNYPVPSVGRIDEEIPCYFGGSFRKIAARPNLRPAQIPRFGESIAKCS